jgi:phage gpG-like protein
MIEVRRIDLRDVENGLRAVQRAGGDLREVFAELKPFIRADISHHFDAQEGIEQDWAPLAQSTRDKIQGRFTGGSRDLKRFKYSKKGGFQLRAKYSKRMERRMTKPLFRLKGQTSYHINRASLRAVSRVPWAAAHDLGAVVGRGSRLPERSFMWISWPVLDRAIKIAEDHLHKAWTR